MFIQTEQTHDPATLRFLPGRQILADGTLDVPDKALAASSPLAARLFAIPGVARISCGKDYIAVTKDAGDWQVLKPVILGTIMEYFLSGAPVILPRDGDAGVSSSPPQSAAPADLRERIMGALRQVIDPELGYNIADLGLIYGVEVKESGDVSVTMTTTTPGCPATGYLGRGVKVKVGAVPGVKSVDVRLAYEPPWTPEMMSDDAKAHFGMRG